MKQVLFLFLALLFRITILGQSISNYAVTRSTGITFNTINATAVPCNSWRYVGGFQQDDNRSNPVDIGFDFWYNGIRYDEVNISTNGYIDFSSSTANGGPTTGPYGYANSQFSAVGGTLNAIAPFYDDQTTQGASDPLGTSIRTLLSGTAPNRVFTIEWLDMAVYLNTSPSLNYQVKLYESTGVIEMLYGTMTAGTASFSYTCGINAAALSAPPTAAQLKCQQTANTTTFNNTAQNNLTTLPASNSKLTFTPPLPSPIAPTGAITFSGVTSNQMTLTWNNWASNEVGYVVYSSLDNINFDFETQTAANVTTASITGLYSSSNYYWRVYAVTEGALSNVLSGTQATLAGGTFISVTSGNWGTGSTWNAGTVPTGSDNVIIANGHTVTINVNASCNNLQIGQTVPNTSVLRIGNNATARTITVNGNITITTGASLTANTASLATHALSLNGNLTNNGTLNLAPTATSRCGVTFTNPYNTQTVGGTGTTNNFHTVNVNKVDYKTRYVDVTTPTFTATAGFLTLTRGTFRLSNTGAVNVTAFTAAATIQRNARLWVNSASVVVNTIGGSITNFGEVRVSNGTLNIGNNTDQNLTSSGGTLTITGGTVNIAGRFDRTNTTVVTIFSMSGGILNLPTVGSTSTTLSPFMMDVPGSQFIQTGGTIVIKREGGNGASDLGFNTAGCDISSVTDGTLRIGDATTPAAQIMRINAGAPIGNLLVSSTNATAQLITNPIRIVKDVTLSSGTFNANSLEVSVGRNWLNTGGTYTPGVNFTNFNGTVAQTITRTTGAETFYSIRLSNAGIKQLGSNINAFTVAILVGSTLDAGSPGYTISMSGNWNNAGTYDGQQQGTIICNGTVAQTIGGTAITNFRNLTIQNTAGVSLTAHENLLGTLSLNSGMFTTTGYDFTLISNAQGTARIGTITGGDITGNIVMQRFIFNGLPTAWHQISTACTGQTFEDWDDDMITAGFPGADYPSLQGFYSIAPYDETKPGPKEIGYAPPTNSTNPILTNRGYYAYIGPLNSGITVDVKGSPSKFTQTIPITYTTSAGYFQDGWNMVPNPYPSSIDWDAASGWTKSGIESAIYIWNPNNNQYAIYVGGVGTNGGSKNIPSSQAFWVHAIAPSPALSMTESVKSVTDQAFMRMSSQPINNSLMRFQVSDGGVRNDEMVIHFDAAASTNFDAALDAWKLASNDTLMPFFGTVLDDSLNLAINTLPLLASDIEIPIRLKVGVSGQYTIRRDSLWNMPKSACIVLEDKLTGTMTDFSSPASYSFQIEDTTEAPRFILHIGAPLTKSSEPARCSNSSDGKAIAKGIGNGPWDYTWLDENGNILATHNGVTGDDTLLNVKPGVYTVQVTGNDGLCGSREDTIIVSGPLPATALALIEPATCSYTNDASIHVLQIVDGTAPYQLEWSNGSSADSLVQIAAGNYWLKTIDANGCSDTSWYTIQSLSSVQANFSLNTDTLDMIYPVVCSNYGSANNYVWDFGDGQQDNDINPTHYYANQGTYTVQLIASDSLCSDTLEHVVFVYNPTGIAETLTSDPVSFLTTPDGAAINFQLTTAQQALIRLYDASGKLVSEQQEQVYQGNMMIRFNGLSQGMYIVQVVLENKQVFSGTVMKQ